MTEKTAQSLKNLCRTCMTCVTTMKRYTRTTGHEQCISDKPFGSDAGPTIMELLQIVQPLIEVQLDDDLPKLMCVGCIQQLQLAHEFVEMYKDSDEKFRKMLKEVQLQEMEEGITTEQQTELSEDQNDSEYSFTKFEIEIGNPPEAIPMQRDTLEIDDHKDEETVQNWMEFEEEPDNTNYEDDEEVDEEEKQKVFDNPYSDASNSEWKTGTETNSIGKNAKVLINRIQKNSKKKSNKSQAEKSIQKRVYKRNLPPKNEDGSISCQVCEAVFENKNQWTEHMSGHSKHGRPKKNHNCEFCGKDFLNKAALSNHIRIHTGEEPYLCIECGKSFKVVSSLNTHMLRHKGEKNFQCPHCPKKFVCSSGLYGHMMVHKKEKPFVCDICGSAFHMAYMLKKHNLYHKDIRNYPCEYCDLRFVTGEKQRRHMRTHTGEKPYRCKYCDRAFAQSNDCNKHMKQHLGENIFQCELCPQRFPLVRDLRVHFATHKGEDEETRTSNLAAREEAEKNLRLKLGLAKKD